MSARGALARTLARVWFRKLAVEGPSLPPGPVLLVLNHPNGLLDPLVPLALLEPGPRFLAKATLWNLLPLRPLLALFRPIPVHRAQDGPDGRPDPAATAATFRTVFAAWEAGERVAIFPEGISHGEAGLAPLKTGAARMVLGSAGPVSLVPAGLVYGRRQTHRHSVLLRLGEPIDCGDLVGRQDPEAVRTLTGRIRAALLPLTVHDADAGRLALAESLAWLLAEGPRSRADLEAQRARVRQILDRLRTLDEVGLGDLQERVAAAKAWLRSRGVRPDQVGQAYPWTTVGAWAPGALLRLGTAALLAPLALAFWPPYAVLGWLVRRLTDDLDQTATFKLLGGLLFHPLWAGGLAVLGWLWAGPAGLLAGVLTLPGALMSLPVLEGLREDLQAVRAFLHRHDPAVPSLLEARAELLVAFPELG